MQRHHARRRILPRRVDVQGKDRRAVLLPNLRLGQRFLIRQHRLRVRAEAVVRLRRQRVFRLAARRFLRLCLCLRLLGLHQRKSLRQHAGNPHIRPGQTAVDQHHAQRHRLARFQAVRLREQPRADLRAAELHARQRDPLTVHPERARQQAHGVLVPVQRVFVHRHRENQRRRKRLVSRRGGRLHLAANLPLAARKALRQVARKRHVRGQNQFNRHGFFRRARVGDLHRVGHRLSGRQPPVFRARHARLGRNIRHAQRHRQALAIEPRADAHLRRHRALRTFPAGHQRQRARERRHRRHERARFIHLRRRERRFPRQRLVRLRRQPLRQAQRQRDARLRRARVFGANREGHVPSRLHARIRRGDGKRQILLHRRRARGKPLAQSGLNGLQKIGQPLRRADRRNQQAQRGQNHQAPFFHWDQPPCVAYFGQNGRRIYRAARGIRAFFAI